MASGIHIDTSEVDKFAVTLKDYPSKAYKRVGDAVKKSTFNIERYAKENITKNGSVDTGFMRNSTQGKVVALTGTVSNNVKYAIMVEDGTKAHIIKPRFKKALYWNGAPHPVRQVRHPGTKGKPFLKPAFEKEVPEFIKALEKAIEPPGGR